MIAKFLLILSLALAVVSIDVVKPEISADNKACEAEDVCVTVLTACPSACCPAEGFDSINKFHMEAQGIQACEDACPNGPEGGDCMPAPASKCVIADGETVGLCKIVDSTHEPAEPTCNPEFKEEGKECVCKPNGDNAPQSEGYTGYYHCEAISEDPTCNPEFKEEGKECFCKPNGDKAPQSEGYTGYYHCEDPHTGPCCEGDKPGCENDQYGLAKHYCNDNCEWEVECPSPEKECDCPANYPEMGSDATCTASEASWTCVEKKNPDGVCDSYWIYDCKGDAHIPSCMKAFDCYEYTCQEASEFESSEAECGEAPSERPACRDSCLRRYAACKPYSAEVEAGVGTPVADIGVSLEFGGCDWFYGDAFRNCMKECEGEPVEHKRCDVVQDPCACSVEDGCSWCSIEKQTEVGGVFTYGRCVSNEESFICAEVGGEANDIADGCDGYVQACNAESKSPEEVEGPESKSPEEVEGPESKSPEEASSPAEESKSPASESAATGEGEAAATSQAARKREDARECRKVEDEAAPKPGQDGTVDDIKKCLQDGRCADVEELNQKIDATAKGATDGIAAEFVIEVSVVIAGDSPANAATVSIEVEISGERELTEEDKEAVCAHISAGFEQMLGLAEGTVTGCVLNKVSSAKRAVTTSTYVADLEVEQSNDTPAPTSNEPIAASRAVTAAAFVAGALALLF